MIEEIYKKYRESGLVCTDSRKISDGCLFFCLKGDSFDGNDFALSALQNGAKYAVVDKDSKVATLSDDNRLIKVDNTLDCLQALAQYHISYLKKHNPNFKVIGLTGTNGKTTSKELISTVLSKFYNVSSTSGNFNNDVGVPLTILSTNDKHDIAVIEMGASHIDDIKRLVKIVQPDLGFITNIGKAHLQGFLSKEGVMQAKGELYNYLLENNGVVFLNKDDSTLMQMSAQRGLKNLQYYGLKYWGGEIVPCDINNPYLRLILPVNALVDNSQSGEILVETHLVGDYNTNNVLVALAIAKYLKLNIGEAILAISEYIPTNNRSQLLKTQSNTIVVDAYNANPTSMECSIKNFSRIDTSLPKYLMLGSMGEVGKDSLKEHMNLLELISKLDFNKVFLVGNDFVKALALSDYKSDAMGFDTSLDLADYLSKNPVNNALILIKGSRFTRMEEVIKSL